jgi:D-3-phosphoglycerate dehydrogenase
MAIVSSGHGFDKIDHDAATEKGVMVTNTAGFCTEEVANHAMMLLLACAKKLVVLDRRTREGKWTGGSQEDLLPMPPLDGQVLGLVGLGNIGRSTARRAQAFGLEVIGYDRYVQPWLAKEARVELVGSLNELASRSDFVSMHTPLNDETRHLVGEAFFKAMKPSAFLINTSRGGTLDEGALVNALQDGEIAGAGLDVLEEEPASAGNPLFAMDNVIVTPHTAGLSTNSVVETERRLGQETARILRGTFPMSLVNPEVRARIPVRPAAVNG